MRSSYHIASSHFRYYILRLGFKLKRKRHSQIRFNFVQTADIVVIIWNENKHFKIIWIDQLLGFFKHKISAQLTLIFVSSPRRLETGEGRKNAMDVSCTQLPQESRDVIATDKRHALISISCFGGGPRVITARVQWPGLPHWLPCFASVTVVLYSRPSLRSMTTSKAPAENYGQAMNTKARKLICSTFRLLSTES